MIIAIDESGSHRQDKQTVIALICVANQSALQVLDEQVFNLEREVGSTEFHWAYRGWPIRNDFVTGLSRFEFSIRIAKIDNPISTEKALKLILPALLPERKVSLMLIDGKKPKQYSKSLRKILRDKEYSVDKLKTVSDHSFPTVRVADAIAGLVRYYDDNPSIKAQKLYRLIESKIEIIHIQKNTILKDGQRTE